MVGKRLDRIQFGRTGKADAKHHHQLGGGTRLLLEPPG